MIGVKIPGSCYLFLISMLNSLRYYFAADNDSWFIFDKPMNLEILKSGDRLYLSGSYEGEQFDMLSTLKFSRSIFLVIFFNYQSVSFYYFTLIFFFVKGKDGLSLFEWWVVVYCYIFIIVFVYYKHLYYLLEN